MQQLLTTKNQKLQKSDKYNYVTFGLHLAPASLSGFNTCPQSTPLCRTYCLNTSGHGAYRNVQEARIKKTRYLFEHRAAFIEQLKAEITLTSIKAKSNGFTPCYRLNVVSDIAWEIEQFGCIPQSFPHLMFYDYTKIAKRVSTPYRPNIPVNYHLTYSANEFNTPEDIKSLVANNVNVAVVFKQLPESYLEIPCISGDVSDLRFLDKKGVIVGLVPKGRARKAPASGFIQGGSNHLLNPQPPIAILATQVASQVAPTTETKIDD